jgi:GNAT superfamily N-acetyltransferase
MPKLAPLAAGIEASGARSRRAESFERTKVIEFVREHWPHWADEVEAGFQAVPPTLYIATRDRDLIGFAAYNVTRPDYFGPTAVLEGERKQGIGRVLLLQCLEALRAEGYAYAIIGGVGPVAYYERTVGASVIPGSDPGIYGGTLLGQD